MPCFDPEMHPDAPCGLEAETPDAHVTHDGRFWLTCDACDEAYGDPDDDDAVTCTGAPDDGCAEAEGLGRCVTCGYVTHDVPQGTDTAHDNLCCGASGDVCDEPFDVLMDDGSLVTFVCQGHVNRAVGGIGAS